LLLGEGPYFVGNFRKILVLAEDESDVQVILSRCTDNIEGNSHVNALLFGDKNGVCCSVRQLDLLVSVPQESGVHDYSTMS